MKNHGFETLFVHRKTEGLDLKPSEKIGFSAAAAKAPAAPAGAAKAR